MKTKVPNLILRVSFLLASASAFIGVLIGFAKGDELGWSPLRGASLFLAFGIMARWWLGNTAKAGLEGRLQSLQSTKKTEDVRPDLGR